jgi:hypothetical protein
VLVSLVYWRHFPDLVALTIVILLHAAGVAYLWRSTPSRWRKALVSAAAGSMAMALSAFLLHFERVARHFPRGIASWAGSAAIAWPLLSLLLLAAFILSRRLGQPTHPGRRAFLRLARGALFGGPAAALGYGVFIQRFQLRLREADIPVPGLPPGLDGLRLVQLTDIHLSPFLSERELERAVEMANETRAHLALVTGDLISSAGDPLDACLAQLARLRADAGVFGCLGNHEIYAQAEAYATSRAARLGMRFLRRQAARLRFGGAALNLAGVDYQRSGRKYLAGAEKLVAADAFNLLLSHNPDVFPVAARMGFPLTIAGHTHGGQVRVEILGQDLNVARFYTPYVDGLYRENGSAVFVSRGIGTIGMPARLGAPPEVALIRLWRS